MADVQIYGLDGALNSHATMTTEQILAAIQRAVTTGEVTDEFQAFIEMIVEQNKKIGIKFWLGTQDEFNALTKTESNTIYFVYTTVIKDISDGIQELFDGLLDGTIKVAAATNADGVVTHYVSGGTDLNNYRGSEYWGKRFYAGGSNSVVNLPYSNGAGFSLEIMRAGSYSTVQRLTSIIAGGSTAYPTVYTRSVLDTATEASGTWTEWQEVAEAKGTYPNMTVGNATNATKAEKIGLKHIGFSQISQGESCTLTEDVNFLTDDLVLIFNGKDTSPSNNRGDFLVKNITVNTEDDETLFILAKAYYNNNNTDLSSPTNMFQERRYVLKYIRSTKELTFEKVRLYYGNGEEYTPSILSDKLVGVYVKRGIKVD